MSFPIGQWWKDRDRNHLITDDHLPKYCDGCPFIAPVCHGGEDGCSVFSNYGDVCHVTEDEKATVHKIIEQAGRKHSVEVTLTVPHQPLLASHNKTPGISTR